jgi:hypothetical protein
MCDRHHEGLPPILLGTWWDEAYAENFARSLRERHPLWVIVPVELEFKDFYIPPHFPSRTEDVPTGDLL